VKKRLPPSDSSYRARMQPMRLAQEVEDTYQRSLAGGFFYLLAWLVVGGYGGAMTRSPALAWALGTSFTLLAIARFVHRPPRDAGVARLQRWLALHWAIVIATSVLWSGVFAWAVLDDSFARARTAALLSTLGLATAFAHTFSMRRQFALLGIAILYLPGLIAMWQLPDARPDTLVMGIYFLYVVVATFRSHADYQRRLDLDQELREQRDLFARQSRVDALTELANRRRFADVLEAAVARARGQGIALSMLVLDIDHFKAINDRHGHATGDAVLSALAARLRADFAAPGETPARLGGEEFGVLLEGPGEEGAAQRGERFREALVANALRVDELALPLTVSIGVAQFDPDAHRDGDGLYRAADRAVYRAKSEGRNRVCVGG
jgi:diguanylate cyclase (GGDEF)-like protein